MTTRAAKTSDAALSQTITREVAKRVVGQEVMVERLLIGLLTGGHVLLEGVPGLAKTIAVRTVAECLRTASGLGWRKDTVHVRERVARGDVRNRRREVVVRGNPHHR